MDSEFKISYLVAGRNILHYAIHPDLGFVWTDGECVYLSSRTDSNHTIPSLHNTRTLGKFSEVTGCSWSQCQASGTYYLAVHHKTCAVVWRVETTRTSSKDPEFKKLYTIEHREHGRGCVWHPRKLLLVVFTKSQVILYGVKHGETNVLDDGLDITAVCWTPDGHHLALADGNQLKIFTMDKECEATTGMQDTFMGGNLGSVCSVTPVSDHIIAIATELPLQKIVTELSADLFSTETSVNEHKEEDIENSSHFVGCETRDSFPDARDHPDGKALVRDLELEAKVKPAKYHIRGNEEVCSSFIKQDAEVDSVILQTSDNINGHHSNSSANDDKSNASRIVEEALKEKTGPIDMMDILTQMKALRKIVAIDPLDEKNERHRRDKPPVHSTNKGEMKNHPKYMDPASNVMNGNEARTCMYQAESSDEKPHYHLIKGLKSASNGGCPEGTRGESSIGGKKIQQRHDSRDKSWPSESGHKVVDLTFLKPQGANGAPKLKQTREPGAGSCARLTLFDVRSKKFISHTDLQGFITPSIIHYQPSSKVMVIGSHSRRVLSIYTLKESSLERLPQTIELGEAERPGGVCSVPDTEGSILVAITRPVSDDVSFRGVLPSSAQEKRVLSLKIVNLPIGQSSSAKEVTASSSCHHDGATSSPGNDDDGLQTLLLPGGVALNANEQSVGRRLGIKVLEEDEVQDAVSVDPLRGNALDVQSQPSYSSLYPSPENAAYVNLRLIKNCQVFPKSFLLQSGVLALQPILDVFHLSHVEMKVGSCWLVLTSDKEGVVPLRFNAGSSYEVREATLANSSR